MAHSASSLRCAHCPVAGVERTLTGGGESDANDPQRSKLLTGHMEWPIGSSSCGKTQGMSCCLAFSVALTPRRKHFAREVRHPAQLALLG